LQALEELFQQVLRLVLEVGALKLGRVALDGSKVKANASKHKAMSYGRMEQTEKLLRKEVQKLLKQGPIQLYRSGVPHHERVGWIRCRGTTPRSRSSRGIRSKGSAYLEHS
jgi:hypothetical protein